MLRKGVRAAPIGDGMTDFEHIMAIIRILLALPRFVGELRGLRHRRR
jgi:hypothetical protein